MEIYPNIDPDLSLGLEMEEVSCTPQSEVNPFGAVRDGRLVVRGMMASAQVLEKPYNTAGNVGLMKCFSVGRDEQITDSGAHTYPDVRGFDEVGLQEEYMFLQVARSGQMLRGLILRPSSQVPGAYERIGVHEYLETGSTGQKTYPDKRSRVVLV